MADLDKNFKLGDTLTITVQVTDKMVRQFAEMSGDDNPIHLDEEYAKTTRFGRRIAHGMLGAALISRALGNGLGPGGIYLGQTLKFRSPIFIDDVLTITLSVDQFREDKGMATIGTLVTKQNGEVCIKGDASIMTKEGISKRG